MRVAPIRDVHRSRRWETLNLGARLSITDPPGRYFEGREKRLHTYATDAPDRVVYPKLFALCAVAASLAFAKLIQMGVSIPWWIDAPSVMGFFGFLYVVFDRYLWHLSHGQYYLSAIPDLRGTWVGTIRSSHDEQVKVSAVLHIRQTWTGILITLETEGSRSVSLMAMLNSSSSAQAGLAYEYLNEPATFSPETMVPHRGVAHLRLGGDGSILKGDYYSGRGRQNLGSMTFCLVSRNFFDHATALRAAEGQSVSEM